MAFPPEVIAHDDTSRAQGPWTGQQCAIAIRNRDDCGGAADRPCGPLRLVNRRRAASLGGAFRVSLRMARRSGMSIDLSRTAPMARSARLRLSQPQCGSMPCFLMTGAAAGAARNATSALAASALPDLAPTPAEKGI